MKNKSRMVNGVKVEMVEMPPQGGGRGVLPKWPWKEMRMGESFVMPVPAPNASSAARRAAVAYKMKFTCRVEGPRQTRIFRVA